jgi:hypothetical protein
VPLPLRKAANSVKKAKKGAIKSVCLRLILRSASERSDGRAGDFTLFPSPLRSLSNALSLSLSPLNVFLVPDLLASPLGFPFDSYQIFRTHRQLPGKEKLEEKILRFLCDSFEFFSVCCTCCGAFFLCFPCFTAKRWSDGIK